jgi:hypothetical protein
MADKKAVYLVSGVEYADESKAIASLLGQHGSGLVDVEWLDVAGHDDANRVFIAKQEAVLWLRYLRNHGRSAYDITQPKEATVSEPKVYFDKDGNERTLTSPHMAKVMLDSGELFRENPKLKQDAKQQDDQLAVQPDGTQNPPAPSRAPAKADAPKGDDTRPQEVKPDGTLVEPADALRADKPAKPSDAPQAPNVTTGKPGNGDKGKTGVL